MQFTGAVSSRSSTNPGQGPPGESEIQKLNPKRRETILATTGWPTLAAGSLNLVVNNNVIFDLEHLTPCWVEDATALNYPAPFEDVPRFRKAYWYYLGKATFSQLCQEVLVRRAQCPVPQTLELLAPVNIKTEFCVADKDILDIDVQ